MTDGIFSNYCKNFPIPRASITLFPVEIKIRLNSLELESPFWLSMKNGILQI